MMEQMIVPIVTSVMEKVICNNYLKKIICYETVVIFEEEAEIT